MVTSTGAHAYICDECRRLFMEIYVCTAEFVYICYLDVLITPCTHVQQGSGVWFVSLFACLFVCLFVHHFLACSGVLGLFKVSFSSVKIQGSVGG